MINEQKIQGLLNKTASEDEALSIIEKAKKLKGLSTQEAAVLLNIENNPGLLDALFNAAKQVKELIYGKRLVVFAPLYLSNHCSNNCLYCGFRKDNLDLKRKTLSQEEIKKEVELLEDQGHKRLLVVMGEHPQYSDIGYMEKSIKTIYATKKGKGAIRRINVNCAPLSLEDFKRLKKCGIGTFQLFQETYHRETYKKMHPSGPKADYDKRMNAIELAFEAGIDDIGIGALYGLYDHKFETIAVLEHAKYMDEKWGVGPHTISVPRLEPALNAPICDKPPYPVSDMEFKKIVAILRLAVPYTGIILSTRESAELRDEVFALGISQISAGSKTNPGSYGEKEKHHQDSEQFSVNDTRSMMQVMKDVSEKGYFPSFCTACYRLGRTGKDFMDLAKPGLIHQYCLPNSILTYKEYLLDYADEDLKSKGEQVIQKQLDLIKNEKLREQVQDKLKQIEKGKRDLYF